MKYIEKRILKLSFASNYFFQITKQSERRLFIQIGQNRTIWITNRYCKRTMQSFEHSNLPDLLFFCSDIFWLRYNSWVNPCRRLSFSCFSRSKGILEGSLQWIRIFFFLLCDPNLIVSPPISSLQRHLLAIYGDIQREIEIDRIREIERENTFWDFFSASLRDSFDYRGKQIRARILKFLKLLSNRGRLLNYFRQFVDTLPIEIFRFTFGKLDKFDELSNCIQLHRNQWLRWKVRDEFDWKVNNVPARCLINAS